MPMIWNAEADATLMAALFQVYNIKINGAQVAEVAKLMGPECTAKAVTHRLQKLRNKASELKAESGDEEAPKPKKTRAPRGSGGKKRGRKAADEDGGEEEQLVTPPSSSKKQKIKAEEDGKEDGIKVGEDIGEGFRATPAGYESEGGELV